MENFAHTLVGWQISRLGIGQRVGRRAGLIGIIAANLPDTDLLLYAVDRHLGLWHHRGFTHSLLGWPVLGILGATVSHRFTGEGRWRDHLALWFAGLLSHSLLDWPTTWGTQLFWPATDTRFSLEWIFIVDPMFWILLGLIPWGLRRWAGWAPPVVARSALLSLGAWILFSGMMHEQVVRHNHCQIVVPAPLAPLNWTGIEDDGEVLQRWFLHPWGKPVHGGSFTPPRGEAVDALRATHVGERALWMAIAPALTEVVPIDGGWRITIQDLGYTSWASPDNPGFRRTYAVRDGAIEAEVEPW